MKRFVKALMAILMVVTVLLVPVGAADEQPIKLKAQFVYTPKSKILNRFNAIRKEACNEGIDGLKSTDYVPIKWSKDMEELAMQRAAEICTDFNHVRLDGTHPFYSYSSTGQRLCDEDLAWVSWRSDAMDGIELWYQEKSDLGGHYTDIIYPGYTYVGVASTRNAFGEGTFTVAVFTYETPTSEDLIVTKDGKKDVSLTITGANNDFQLVNKDNLSTMFAGETGTPQYRIKSGTLNNSSVKWSSSDASIVKVDKNGKITALKNGTAKISTKICDKTYSYTVKVQSNGWKTFAKGKSYKNPDGTWSKNRWQKISKKWYYFDKNGYAKTGWFKDGGKWYYFDLKTCAMKTGWVKEETYDFYTAKSTVKYYYMNSSGAMTTGWQKDAGKWYYMNSSGVMQRNKWIGNYYVQKDGSMATNKWIGKYHVNKNGKWDKTR